MCVRRIFMKIPVGVVGYGNLGKSVVTNLQKNNLFQLEAVFSKRNLPISTSYSDILKFKDKIEFLFVCGGSQNELEDQTTFLIKHFNLIESYDNHNRLKSHIQDLDKIAKEHHKIALCSFGWDPGLFSLMRGLFDGLGQKPYSFWGKGLSQGHTQAIKNIEGVIDALQFTLPKKEIISKIKHGENLEISKDFHKRLCFVVCPTEKRTEIEQKIKSMPDYFLGYETEIKFVSQDSLNKLKSFAHKGQVLTANNMMNFSLNLPSNPEFTANVMTTFARAYPKLKEEKKYGAHDIFDIPMKHILKDEPYKYL